MVVPATHLSREGDHLLWLTRHSVRTCRDPNSTHVWRSRPMPTCGIPKVDQSVPRYYKSCHAAGATLIATYAKAAGSRPIWKSLATQVEGVGESDSKSADATHSEGEDENMEVREGIFVDGEWRPSTGDAMFTVVNPYTEEPFGRTTVSTAADVDLAVRSAHLAQTDGEWRNTPVAERIAVVKRIQELIAARAGELAHLATSTMGRPYKSSLSLGNSVELIDMYVEMVHRVQWEFLRMGNDGNSLIVRRPVGVVAGIVPWNTPVRSEVKKVIPALLTGCATVLKSAPETPFGAAIFVEICSEAGVPPGVVNLVPGDATTGDLLVRHPMVRKVAFTGSSATGSKIWAATAENFTRLQLELGGKSAAIVLDDVDLETAVPMLSAGIFSGTGQQCTATSRILAPRSRYEEVVEAMTEAASSYAMGDPFDAATTLGPLVAERQLTRVLRYVDIGISENAKLVVGGRRPGDQPRGWFIEPTVFANVDNAMRIAQEEIFGPVVSIIPFEDEREAIGIANDSEYGLGGSIYSADSLHALDVARRIDSGYIAINRYGIPATAPFGGVKHSGIGREHGVEGFDSFLEYVPHPLTREFAEQLAETIPLG
jgi:aldehyde dehydrogenase (NAD+)